MVCGGKELRRLISQITTEYVMIHTTKTKSSYRSLPLVKPFEEILLRMKQEQEENKRLCGRCYCQDYLDYIYVNQIGEIVKPGFVTAHFSAVLKANSLPHIRFHDLRHPYVKHATKIFSLRLKFFQAQPLFYALRETRGVFQYLLEGGNRNPFPRSCNKMLSS